MSFKFLTCIVAALSAIVLVAHFPGRASASEALTLQPPESAFSTPSVTTDFVDGVFARAPWGRPFWADMHSTLTRGEVALALNSKEYDWAGKGEVYRPYVFANLGADLPVWAGSVIDDRRGVSVTLPFFVDVWLDMFERTTAPVINTAYRFGLPEINGIWRLQEPWLGIQNVTLKLSPLMHECTHIGDELAIERKDAGMPITRVNVSYNYSLLELTINDPVNTPDSNHAFRIGLMLLHDWNNGWYNVLPSEADVTLVDRSRSPYEAWIQYQYQSGTYGQYFQTVFSLEARDRLRYNYPFTYGRKTLDEWGETLSQEYRAIAFNGFLGIRYRNPAVTGSHSTGIGLRTYVGMNPYGQFRALPAYQQIGLAIVFE